MKNHIIFISSLFFLFSCGNGGNDKNDEGQDFTSVQSSSSISHDEMEMKEMAERQKNQTPKESPYKNSKISIRIFNNDTVKLQPKVAGFGYDIFIDDAMYVHQPHIPAINGNRGFKTQQQATKAAEFVVYKIRNNIMPPSMSVEELDSLGTLK